MSLRSRLASRRVKAGFGTALATFALLGSGLVAAVPAQAVEAPEVQRVAKQTNTDQRRNFWGAIKMAKDGAYGKAWDFRTERRAKKRAGRECREVTQFRCNRVWVTTVNSCAAIAVRWRNGRIVRAAYSYGFPTKRKAVRRALRKCKSDGLNCRRRAWVCTSGRN